MVHWEIFDLQRLDAAPQVILEPSEHFETTNSTPYLSFEGAQESPRGYVLWGPADRFVRLREGPVTSFVEGRTGQIRDVAMPEDLWVLPYWASDGSGVFVTQNFHDVRPDETCPRQILRPDGTLLETSTDATSMCGAASFAVVTPGSPGLPRHTTFACSSPDDATRVQPSLTNRFGLSLVSSSGAQFEIDGTFAGWLAVPR